ncbi:MAG: hypothetical protein AAGA70_11450 [Pseudomonadota bacterium]
MDDLINQTDIAWRKPLWCLAKRLLGALVEITVDMQQRESRMRPRGKKRRHGLVEPDLEQLDILMVKGPESRVAAEAKRG